MKLDMYEINKLNPPGILELAGLLALIKRLIAMVADFGEANTASVRHARIINQNLKRLREGHEFNTNLRIRAWVLETAERRAWARRVIGENRIARWQQKYDALARHELPPPQKPADKTSVPQNASAQSNKPGKPCKSYERKPFGLPRLADLFIMPFDFSNDTAFPTFDSRIATLSRPRRTPGRKPVIFWPHELTPDYPPDTLSNPDTSEEEPIPAPDADAEPLEKKQRKTGNPWEPKPP